MHSFASLRHVRRALIGLILLLCSQYLMLRQQPVPYNILSIFSKGLQFVYRIDIDNLDNVLVALTALAVGSVFLWRGMPLPSSEPVPGDAHASADAIESFPPGAWWLLGSAALIGTYVLYDLRTNTYSNAICIPWLYTVALLILVCARSDRQRAISLQLGLDAVDYLSLITLTLLGLAISSYHLQLMPAAFIGDEWAFWTMARDIARGVYYPVPLGFGVYSYPVLSSIYQGAVVALFGESVWSWRFGSVLAAVAAIAPTYWLARSLFTRQIAIISGILLIVMPYFLAFARIGYNNSQAIAPVTLTLCLVYIGSQRTSMLYTLLAGCVAGASFYTYTAGRLGIVVAALFLGSFVFTEIPWPFRALHTPRVMRACRRSAWLMAALALGWAAIALPHLVYGSVVGPQNVSHKTLESFFANVFYGRSLYVDGQLFRDRPPIPIGDQRFFFRADLYVQLLVRGVVRTSLAFLHPTIAQQYFIVGPLPGPTLAIPSLCGFLLALYRRHMPSYRLLVIWSISGCIILSVVDTFPPRQAHLIVLMPVLALYSAHGLSVCAAIVAQPFVRWQHSLWRALVLVGLFLAVSTGLYSYFVTMPQRYTPTPEDVMNMRALALQQPEQMVYVTTEVQKQHFVPIAIREMRTAARFQTVVLSNSPAETLPIALDSALPFTVFTRPQDVDVTEHWLQRSFGLAFQRQPIAFQGRTVLIAYTLQP